jgi:hypothetical protein
VRTLRWSEIKEAAIHETELYASHDLTRTAISAWDIRCVKALIEKCPTCVPAAWWGRPLKAEMLDDGEDWIVFPADTAESV